MKKKKEPQVGDVVKYSHPAEGEANFRFLLITLAPRVRFEAGRALNSAPITSFRFNETRPNRGAAIISRRVTQLVNHVENGEFLTFRDSGGRTGRAPKFPSEKLIKVSYLLAPCLV